MPDKIAIEYVPITDLHPAEYNPRRIDDANLQRLTDGLERYGIVDPIAGDAASIHEAEGGSIPTVALQTTG